MLIINKEKVKLNRLAVKVLGESKGNNLKRFLIASREEVINDEIFYEYCVYNTLKNLFEFRVITKNKEKAKKYIDTHFKDPFSTNLTFNELSKIVYVPDLKLNIKPVENNNLVVATNTNTYVTPINSLKLSFIKLIDRLNIKNNNQVIKPVFKTIDEFTLEINIEDNVIQCKLEKTNILYKHYYQGKLLKRTNDLEEILL